MYIVFEKPPSVFVLTLFAYVFIAGVCCTLGYVGKAKQHSRQHKVYQTRNLTGDRREKMQCEPSTITDEDRAHFAACQTKAAEVCM